jgi:hypothetical protein
MENHCRRKKQASPSGLGSQREIVGGLAEPRRFPFFGTTRLFRRIRLDRFPYVGVYRELPDSVRVTVIKHEKRQVRYGMKRR